MEILTSPQQIFEHGNRHLTTKLRYLGKSEGAVIKYIISKLRKYHGQFFEKYKGIADELGCSYKTVQRAVNHGIKLGIFIVSERTEPTLEGKNRKTTNLIQLLPYAPFEFVNGVIKIVKKQVKSAIKLVDKAKEMISKGKESKQGKNAHTSQKQAPNSGQKWCKKAPIRTEILPAWFDQKDEDPKPLTPDQEGRMAGILEKLNKFRGVK